MNREQIIEKIKIIVQPYSANKEAISAISEETDFIRDLNINSANLVDIVLDIEEAFNLIIDNAEMERMLTVRAAIDIVETKLAEK